MYAGGCGRSANRVGRVGGSATEFLARQLFYIRACWMMLSSGDRKLGQIGAASGRLHFRSFFNGTMLAKNGITLPKTSPALCRVFVPAVARLRMLRMSPGAVLNIAPFITALLGVIR